MNAEAAHQRLGAVMPGADADPFAVEQLGDVVGVHPGDGERDHAAAFAGRGWAEDLYSFEFAEQPRSPTYASNDLAASAMLALDTAQDLAQALFVDDS